MADEKKLTPAEQADLEYLEGVDKAMRRAAERAREIARQTGTEVVYERDGKIVKEKPSK